MTSSLAKTRRYYLIEEQILDAIEAGIADKEIEIEVELKDIDIFMIVIKNLINYYNSIGNRMILCIDINESVKTIENAKIIARLINI